MSIGLVIVIGLILGGLYSKYVSQPAIKKIDEFAERVKKSGK